MPDQDDGASAPSPRVGASPFSIGEPGRAAREMPAGVPATPSGHSDVELSVAACGGILLRAATCRGLLHRAFGEPRQDAFATAYQAAADSGHGGHLVAAVCDGVGSLRRSGEAATLVSRRLAELGCEGVPWPEAFKLANEELRAAAAEVLRGVDDPAEGMATTAVAASVRRDGDGWAGEVAWGDSALWHLDPARRWTLLSTMPGGDDVPTSDTDLGGTGARPEPDADIEPGGSAGADDGDDPFAWSQVSALPSADGACTVRVFRCRGGALFLMTDGVANPLQWADDVQAALAHWWAAPPDPFTFAAQVSFARRSHTDDRTVVGLWLDREDDA